MRKGDVVAGVASAPDLGKAMRAGEMDVYALEEAAEGRYRGRVDGKGGFSHGPENELR